MQTITLTSSCWRRAAVADDAVLFSLVEPWGTVGSTLSTFSTMDPAA